MSLFIFAFETKWNINCHQNINVFGNFSITNSKCRSSKQATPKHWKKQMLNMKSTKRKLKRIIGAWKTFCRANRIYRKKVKETMNYLFRKICVSKRYLFIISNHHQKVCLIYPQQISLFLISLWVCLLVPLLPV